MSNEIPNFIPAPPPAADIFATHQLSFEFHREVEYREEFQGYCRWYRLVAAQHRQELAKMQGDIAILAWFLGRKSRV